MQLMTTKKIGKNAYHFTVEGSNLFDCIIEQQKLSFPNVDECGLCGSTNLELTARVAQDKFKYSGIRCNTCGGDVTFGKTQKDENTYFLRRDDSGGVAWKKYEKEGNASNGGAY